MQVVGVLAGPYPLQLVGGESEFVEMLRSGPAPGQLALRRDLVDHVIDYPGHGEALHRVDLVRQQQGVAVGQPALVVVLMGGAARRLVTPAPDLLAIPVQLAEGLVGQAVAGRGQLVRSGQVGQLQQHMAALAAVQGRVDHGGGEAGVVPALHLVAVHVDQVGLAVCAAEDHVLVEGLLRVVAGHSGGGDAGRGMGAGGEQRGAEQEHRESGHGGFLGDRFRSRSGRSRPGCAACRARRRSRRWRNSRGW